MAAGYDIAIVGAGAAGCLIARRLAEAGDASVALVEAGPDLTGSETPEMRDGWHLPTIPDWGFASEPGANGGTGRLRRGRLVGGTSWLTRFAVRGHRADFDAWSAAGNPGWAFDDVLPAFRRIERDLEFGTEPWHGQAGPLPITRYPALDPSAILEAAGEAFEMLGFPVVADLNGPEATGLGRMPMSSVGGARVTAADAWLATSDRPSNLTILTDSLVDSITHEGGRAAGVRLADGSVVPAGRVILCAGTYGSPPILLRSGIGPSDHLREIGVPIAIDLPGVGSNLADHPATELDSGWRGPGRTTPILHSIATWRSATAATNGPPDLMLWVMDPESDDGELWLDPVLLKPRSRGTVRLRSGDAAEPPRITLPGLADRTDIERLGEGVRMSLALAAQPSMRRILSGPPPSAPRSRLALHRQVVDAAYSIPHVVGTCAMGPSAEGGAVVDHLGRVHGADGLFVADASIIPDAPSGFPHLVTLMLAEHLATRWESMA